MSLIEKGNCFVFSSKREWFWRVLIESMACWTPIISTDCPVWPKEILKKELLNFNSIESNSACDFGILVPNNNQEELIKAMIKINNNSKLQKKYIREGERRALDFDYKNIVKKRESII